MREDPLRTLRLRGGPRCPQRTLHPLPFVHLNQPLSCQILLETLLLLLTELLSQHRGFHFFLSITVQNTKYIKPALWIISFWISMTPHTYIPSKMAAPALEAMIQIQVKGEEIGGKILRYRQDLVNLVLLVQLSFRHL